MKPVSHASSFTRLTLTAFATTALLSSNTAQSAIRNWDGDTSATWATAGNWDTAPVTDLTTDIANFNLATYGGNPVFAPNAGTTSIAGISIGGSNGNMTLATAALSIGASGITVASGAGTTSIAAVKIGANQNWQNDSSSLLTFSSTVTNVGNVTPFTVTINGSGSGGTTITGVVSNGGVTGTTALTINTTAGTTTLNGANTFTGGLTLTQGTLKLGNNASLGGAGNVFTIGGGTVDVTAARTTTNNNAQNWNGDFTFTGSNTWNTGTGAITLGGNRQVTTSASTMTVGGAIGDGGNGYTLTKAGAGTLVLGGNNTFSGGITLGSGTLTINNAGALGTGTLMIGAGTTINSATAITNANNNAQIWNGNFTFTGTNSLDLGTGAVTIAGPLTLTTSANSLTFGGAISGGTIFDIMKAGAGTLAYTRNITLSGTQTLTITAGTEIFSGILSGSDAGLTLAGAGTLTLSNTNTYTGATTVSSGTLTLSGANGSVAASSSLTGNGATVLNFDSSAAGVTGATRANNVTLNGAALAVIGNSGANSVDRITGALTISPVNSGTISSSSAIVPINNTVTVTANAATNAQLVADTLVRANNAVVLFRGTNLGANTIASATAGTSNISFTTAPTAALVGGGGAAGSQNISIIPWAVGDTSATGTGSGFVTYDANGIRPLTSSEYDTSMTGGVSNDHNVKISLPATLTVNGATTVNSLFLTSSLSTGGLLNGTGALTVTSGAVALDYSAVGPNKGAYLEIAKQLDFGTAQGVISSNNTFAANSLFQRGAKISGGIGGSGGLVLSTSQLSGGGGITFTAATTYTGDTYVLGDVTTTVDNVFPNAGRTGDLYLYGTIAIGTANLTMNGLNGSGIIAGSSNARTLTVGSNGAGGTFSGAYLDAGIKGFALTKTGGGTQVLSGTSSTFAGKTSIQNGILSVVTLNSVTGGTATSSLGTPNSAANGTISLGNLNTNGTLTVVGAGETTDRVIALAGQTGGGTLDQSGTGLLKFTSNFTSAGLAATDQRKTLTLKGSTVGTGEISGAIVDSVLGTAGQKATSVTKTGTGTWTLSGTNTYSGATTVSNGTLIVSGSIANSSTTVGTGAAFSLASTGTAGAVTVNGGTFHLGTAGTAGTVAINDGTFSGAGTVDSLTFNGTSVFGPGNSPGGTLIIADGGSLTLSSGTTSTFHFTSSGFGVGTFDLITTPNFATGDLAGILNLDFTGTGYTAGTSVTFIQLSSFTGTFSSVNVTGLTGLTATVNYDGAPGEISLTLVAAAIPEPSTCALLGGTGVIIVALGYRRRTQRSTAA